MKRIPWTFVFPFDNGGETSVTGYTPLPEKGVDYDTPADQEAIVQQVIAALGTPVFGRVEADKKIILTANGLPDGTYELWFEDEEGAQSKICDYTHGGPAYTNQIPISADANGSVYNGTGYKNEYRLNTSGAETAATGMGITGFIPCKPGDILYLSGIATKGGNSTGWYKLQFYNESKTSIGLAYFHDNYDAPMIGNTANLNAGYVEQDGNGYLTKITLSVYNSGDGTGIQANSGTIDSSFRYVRVVCGTISSASIVTVNQPITGSDAVTHNVPLSWDLGVKLSKTDNTSETVSYDPASASTSYAASQNIPVESGAVYTVGTSHATWNVGISVCYFNASGGFVGYAADVLLTESNGRDPVTFTPPSGAATMRLRMWSPIDQWNGLAARTEYVYLQKTV